MNRWLWAAFIALITCGVIVALIPTPSKGGRALSRQRALPPHVEQQGDNALILALPKLLNPEKVAVSHLPRRVTDPGRKVSGRVVDGTGGVIVEARVAAILEENSAEGSTVVRTDSDGTFDLSLNRGPARICAEAEAYSRYCLDVTVPSDGNDFILVPASNIRGTVVKRQDLARVANARVLAVNRIPADDQRETLTDQAGEFELTSLSTGVYELVAIAPGSRSAEVLVGVALGATETVQLVTVPAANLEATVLMNGDPCSGGTVSLAGPVSATGTVARDGLVTINGIPSGTYETFVTCPGGVPLPGVLEIEPGREHQAVAHVWDLAALPSLSESPASTNAFGVIRATVAGQASQGIAVCSRSADQGHRRAVRMGNEFVIDRLPIGTYDVYVGGMSAQSYQVSITRAGEEVRVNLTVQHNVQVSGQVVGLDDEPVPNVWISYFKADDSLDDCRSSDSFLSDDDGRFSFVAFADSNYTVFAKSYLGEAVAQQVIGGSAVVLRLSPYESVLAR